MVRQWGRWLDSQSAVGRGVPLAVGDQDKGWQSQACQACGEGGVKRRSLSSRAGNIHEEERFKNFGAMAGELQGRYPGGNRAGQVDALQSQRVEKGGQAFGGRLRLATFVSNDVAELAEE